MSSCISKTKKCNQNGPMEIVQCPYTSCNCHTLCQLSPRYPEDMEIEFPILVLTRKFCGLFLQVHACTIFLILILKFSFIL